MTRTFNGELFKAEAHIARLFHSIKYADLAVPLTPGEVLELTRQVVQHNRQFLQAGEDLAVVQFVTAGESAMYSDGAPILEQPTVCIHTFRLPFARWRSFFVSGARVAVPSTRHIPPQCIEPKTKNRSRLHWHLAEREVKKNQPDAIPLLLDLDGNLTETPGANFLIYKKEKSGGTIFSPRSRNILQGISLQTVREIASELNINWIEKDLQIYDALGADEAWLTSTPYGIAPCTRVNGHAIGSGEIGPGWNAVIKAWSERVNCDIASQILHHK
jgi:branched-subunit amino acid aminotransferase/4-amino-4-deoxychorismate lyase